MTHTKSLDVGQTEGAQAAQSRTSGRFVRRAWTAVLTLAAPMGLMFLNAGSAAALNSGDVIGTNFLRNWATGRCLDSNAAQDVYTLPCQSGNSYQTWSVIYAGYDFVGTTRYDMVMIKNQATGKCLHWAANNSLRTATCGFTTWIGVGSGWDQVELRHANGVCVDSDSNGNAYLLGCNGGGYQKWKLGY